MFSLICAWTNDWVNNREADLSRNRVHFDVAVMISLVILETSDTFTHFRQDCFTDIQKVVFLYSHTEENFQIMC